MTWIVTGASRGLGRQLVLQLTARGHAVLAVSRDRERLQALAQAAPGLVTPLTLDLADPQAIAAVLPPALAALPQVTGLVNNAGIGRFEPFAQSDPMHALQVLQVNLGAAMQCTHAVLPYLLARRAGHIVNIASDLARRPLAGMAAYVASKHGLAGFSHSLLREVRPQGVKVTLVNPGIIDTNFGAGPDQDLELSRQADWSLPPAALAALIVQVVEQPEPLMVDELTVHPVGQGEF